MTTPPGPNAAGEPALQATGPGGQPVRRLLRSASDRRLAGVCGGQGRYLNMDPTLFRIIYAVATVFTGIIPGLILYIILAIVIPSDDNMPS